MLSSIPTPGSSRASKSSIHHCGKSWCLYEVVGDGTCMYHCAYKHPYVRRQLHQLTDEKVKNGMDLRLYVIKYMEINHPDEFNKLCKSRMESERVRRRKAFCIGATLSSSLSTFVDKHLKRRKFYLGLDFALMVSFCFGVEFILVSNTVPVTLGSTYSYAKVMKSSDARLRY